MAYRQCSKAVHGGGLPEFWSVAADDDGGRVLTYAVRGGAAQAVTGALGIGTLLVGLWGAYWLLGDGITVGGVVLLALLPGGLLAFGLHCVDIAWFARSEYRFDRYELFAGRYRIWGNQRYGAPRASMVEVEQPYTPPPKNSATGSNGTWATVIHYRDEKGNAGQLAFDGIGSIAEARWLGGCIAQWAPELSFKRGYSAGFDEAAPEELPRFDAPAPVEQARLSSLKRFLREMFPL